MNRREFLGRSAATAFTSSSFYAIESFAQTSASGAYKSIHKPLDRFVVPQQDGTFRFQGDEADTEWMQCHDVVDGYAQRVKLCGEDLWRVLAP